MKRIVLLVAIFVFALSLAVPAFVSVDLTPASSDARLTNSSSVDVVAYDPDCPPAPWVGGGGGC